MGRRRVNIGNRKSAQEAAEEATSYTADALNQYTAIQQGSGETAESLCADLRRRRQSDSGQDLRGHLVGTVQRREPPDYSHEQ